MITVALQYVGCGYFFMGVPIQRITHYMAIPLSFHKIIPSMANFPEKIPILAERENPRLV